MRGLAVVVRLASLAVAAAGVVAGSAALVSGAAALVSGCHPRAPCAGSACTATCPRDATPDGSGRCTCRDGTVNVLGACVVPAVADAYCMPPARSTASGGCAMPVCASTDAVDMETGCVPLSGLLAGGAAACPADAALVVDARRASCIPRDAACPRGTTAQGAACVSPMTCPAGSLARAGACVPIVTRGVHGVPRVDVGAWAAYVLGIDGGDGAPTLCRPIAAHPAPFALAAGDKVPLAIRVALAFPDVDVASVHATVAVSATGGHALPPAAVALVESSVGSLVEPLRGLGGEASAGMVELEVRCLVASLAP